MISDSFLREIAYKNDLVEVASSYTTLKRSGRNLVGLCPFHAERTPSFNVYSDNQSFYCFGCGVGGDVITFIKLAENLEFMDAVKLLADRAGIPMEDSDWDSDRTQIKNKIYEINREAAKFFHRELYGTDGRDALKYIQRRGLTPYTVKHFGLGYSPKSRFELSNHLNRTGFSREDIVMANLAFVTNKGKLVDRFVNRVMFPIIDSRGNVIAFGGRAMNEEKPKYLNTSDTLVFKKSHNLFALNFAKKKSASRIILAEGYMDVIALHQAGFSETVATLGTSLTVEQAKVIRTYTDEVVIAYDADEAGQKATSRAINILRDVGLLIKVITIPNGKDPDEFLKLHKDNGSVKFKQLIDSSGNDIEYRLERAQRGLNLQAIDSKIEYLKRAIKILASVDDAIQREVYIGKISFETDVQKSVVASQVLRECKKKNKLELKREFKKIQENLSGIKNNVNPQKASNIRASCAEEGLIAYVMSNQDVGKVIFDRLPPGKFLTDFNRQVYQFMKSKLDESGSISTVDFACEFTDAQVSHIVRILTQGRLRSDNADVADDYIKVISSEWEKKSIIDSQNNTDEDIIAYLQGLREAKK